MKKVLGICHDCGENIVEEIVLFEVIRTCGCPPPVEVLSLNYLEIAKNSQLQK